MASKIPGKGGQGKMGGGTSKQEKSSPSPSGGISGRICGHFFCNTHGNLRYEDVKKKNLNGEEKFVHDVSDCNTVEVGFKINFRGDNIVFTRQATTGVGYVVDNTGSSSQQPAPPGGSQKDVIPPK